MYKLIDIGHSRGVRIPKQLIQQAKLDTSDLEFEVLPQGLLIKPHQKNKRQGWADVFKHAAPVESGEMLEVTNTFDEEGWVWEAKV